MRNTIIVIIIVIIVVAVAVYYVSIREGSVPQAPIESSQQEQGLGAELYENPAGNVPEVKPLEETNPFGAGETNPFKGIETNPFE